MTRNSNHRTISNEARRTQRRIERGTVAAEKARTEVVDAYTDLVRIVSDIQHRFGIVLPNRSPLLLDVLSLIEVVAPDRGPTKPGWASMWMWHGPTNNMGLPVVRLTRAERPDGVTHAPEVSAARWLAIQFGMMSPGDTRQVERGPTYPVADVNPRHRYLGGKPLGLAS